MHSCSGKLCQHGQVVRAGVRGTLEVRKGSTGDTSWSGYLNVPRGANLEEAASYFLLLDDGRCGVILTARMSLVQGRVLLRFLGTSPLQAQENGLSGNPAKD